MKQIRLPTYLLLFSVAFFTACDSGGNTGKGLVKGVVQKGAFQEGSSIVVQELTANAADADHRTTGTISDDLGSYSITTGWSGWAEITVSGSYFDEYAAQVINIPIALNGIQQITDGNQVINVNLFSHFIAARIKQRVQGDSDSLAVAKTGAEGELQSALDLAAVNSDRLDLHEGEGDNSNANAALLLFSGSFMAVGDNPNLLATLTDDFKVDGVFDLANIRAIQEKANEAGMLARLTKNISDAGVASPPDIDDFEDVPDWASPVNESPIAEDVNATGDEDSVNAITLVATDPESDALSYIKQGEPAHGSLTIVTDVASYMPEANYYGEDSFTYKVNDGRSDSNTATVNITVTAVNDAPEAEDVDATGLEDSVNAIALVATDIESDALSYIKLSDPAHGLITIVNDVANYTPEENYNGPDSFTYKANDGDSDSNIATVNITVTAVNDAPIANAGDDISVVEGKTITLDGSNSSDLEGVVSYSWSPAVNLNTANISKPRFSAPSVSDNTESTLSLTVQDTEGLSDSDSVVVTILNLPAQPQNVEAIAGNKQVLISWDAVSDANTYDICVATETIGNPISCASGALLTDQNSSVEITELTNDTKYYFVVVPRNTNGDGVVSAEVSATPINIIEPSPTGKLNDTGIVTCGDYAFESMYGSNNHENDLACSSPDSDGDKVPPNQDATTGRDIVEATNDDSDGHKGFSFIKIASNGQALAIQDQAWSWSLENPDMPSDSGTEVAGTQWSCVKDNVTGLIWEIKSSSRGTLHAKEDAYTWYNSDGDNNGGSAGYQRQSDSLVAMPYDNSCSDYVNGTTASYCNSQAYVARVNVASFCGASDWRMPTQNELHSLVNYDNAGDKPMIDNLYFPNAQSFDYWSSTPFASDSNTAWNISLLRGERLSSEKSSYFQIRLVRSGGLVK